MKTIVIYDNDFRNTELIARSMASAIAGDCRAVCLEQADPSELKSVDLLFAGSPSQGGRPTKTMQEFLNSIPQSAVRRMRVAAFDTRPYSKSPCIFASAAGRIAQELEAKGAALVACPQGFFIEGEAGTLKEGELKRADTWAKETAKNLSLVEALDRLQTFQCSLSLCRTHDGRVDELRPLANTQR